MPEKRYLRRSAWHNETMFETMFFFSVQGSRHTWTLKKNIVSNIVSLPPLNYPPSVLAVLLVVVLVVVLLSCCCRCLCLLCCHVANTPAATTIGTLLPPPPPPPPSVGKEDDACYTNTDSSPATSTQAVCQALEYRASLDRPSRLVARAAKAVTMMAALTVVAKLESRTGSVWSSPPPPEAARRQQGWRASEGRGNEEGDYNGDKVGKQ